MTAAFVQRTGTEDIGNASSSGRDLDEAGGERFCTKIGVCGLCRTAVWHCIAEVRVCRMDISNMWPALEWERRAVVALWVLAVQAAPELSMSLLWTPVLNQ